MLEAKGGLLLVYFDGFIRREFVISFIAETALRKCWPVHSAFRMARSDAVFSKSGFRIVQQNGFVGYRFMHFSTHCYSVETFSNTSKDMLCKVLIFEK